MRRSEFGLIWFWINLLCLSEAKDFHLYVGPKGNDSNNG